MAEKEGQTFFLCVYEFDNLGDLIEISTSKRLKGNKKENGF